MHEGNFVATVSTILCSTLFLFTAGSMGQMFARLHTYAPASSKLMLRTGKGKSLAEANEFYVGGEPPPPPPGHPSLARAPTGVLSAAGYPAGHQPPPTGRSAPDESSSLLCFGDERMSRSGA